VLIEKLPDYRNKLTREEIRVVSKRQPTEEEWLKLFAAWDAVWRVPSNAVVIGDGRVADGKLEAFWTSGIGTSTKRNRAAKMATENADDTEMLEAFNLPYEPRAGGAVAASDGFFPRTDGLDALGEKGVAVVISGEGGVHAQEVIEAADEWGIAYVLYKRRIFSH
jgi:phosphoribosylaminoimidazolecarboxamide formyltransferase/IMP cyclohydrolase